MDHSELVQEMVLLEKLTAQERLKHAKRRRQQQLANWARREVSLNNNTIISSTMINGTLTSISNNKKSKSVRSKNFLVQFPENIVLLEATARQDVDEVRNLLQSGKYNPNTANEDGLTPIHQCSIDNSDQILRLLIEYGGDVNAKDRDLWTPLHAAATCGHIQICKILIENGAELLALNADGNMPYDICDDDQTLDYIETQMDRIGITQEMIDKTRAQVENQMLSDLKTLAKKSLSSARSIDDILSYRNEEGATPLHIASANGYQTVVEYLLQQHVSINLQDADGWSPIHAAAFWCQQPILSQLIEAGADIYEKIPDGRSAVDLCDDPDLRTYMIDFREQCVRNKERAAAEAAAAAAAAAAAQVAQLQQKTNTTNLINTRLQIGTNSLPHGITPRTGTLYESRSSISSPYGSGSSLNRTSSIRRASLRDREKVKKLNENFLDVLQAKDKIQEDVDENSTNPTITNGTIPSKVVNKEECSSSTTTTTTTDSTIRETTTTTNLIKKPTNTLVIDLSLPPLKVPPPLPPVQTTADTLSDVKRRREERRRGVGGPSSSSNILPPPPSPPTVKSLPLPTIEIKQETNYKISNGNHLSAINDPINNYSAKKYIEMHSHISDDDREKRICCTIL
ncbi:unnamed protein product [Rotaria sp. Silwood1]|nr:unnamed protein product [Rotaria sp. Silwood1]CAF3342312.1 unnamed protein product [Rotaria sp. Silwood1]CAF3346456.1 unnamed protein product [Rotaria sp. Silwood1]CAF3350779.1 unnamed protein product [Rotaria sp. Silwood1]CAF4494599.1 unnamed protein product [Rotaria sp. Silwood1]